jgi:hypothetical protein
VRSPQGKQSNLTKFPVSALTYDPFGPGNIKNWAAAAQIHYSFLQHLEQADAWRYKFNTWDYIYERLYKFHRYLGLGCHGRLPIPGQR